MKTSKRNSKRVTKRNKQFSKLVLDLFKDFWHQTRLAVMQVSTDRCESLVEWLKSLPKKIETFRLDSTVRFRMKRDSRFTYSLRQIERLSNDLAMPELYPESYEAILLALKVGFHFGIVCENPAWLKAERAIKDTRTKRKLAKKTNRIKRRSLEMKSPVIRDEFQKVTRGNPSLSVHRAMEIVANRLTDQHGRGFSFSTVRRIIEK